VQTNVLIKEECILKNKSKLCPYKKLSVFYNICLKSFGSNLVNTDQAILKLEEVVHKELKTVQNDCGCTKIICSLTTEAIAVITGSGCEVRS